jgi:EpsI family protein
MFWIGRRWHDDVASTRGQVGDVEPAPRASWRAWWPLPLACGVALAGPPLVDNSISQARLSLATPSRLIVLPDARDGWQGPGQSDDLWRPLYHGGFVERQARYVAPDQAAVDVFVAVYGLGNSVGAEMISYSNVIAATERKSLATEVHRKITLADGSKLPVREVELAVDGNARVVWYWFVVGDQQVTRELSAKALEAIAFITRNADSERIVTISTASGAGARERLQAFMEAHGACVAHGFSPGACPR